MSNLSKSRLYPLILEPIYKYRIWGGRKLERILGKKLPANESIGEAWETSCRDNDNNVIKNGELAGRTLADVFTTHKTDLLGSRLVDVPKFPLLNKFIDANDLLSVQVHPDEAAAMEFSDAEAKSEAWYIIHAEPGATLIKGLRPGVTKDAFEDAILNDTLPTVLNSFPISTGDMVFVPAGCVHAMGKGLIICEIQQNSDTTYRVYDWGRIGADGKPRQLHIERALQVINFEDDTPDKIQPVTVSEGRNERIYLVACRYFAMQVLALDEPTKESTGRERFESLMIMNGKAAIQTTNGDETNVSTGESVLIPACLGDYRLLPSGRCVIMRVFIPDVETEIVQELRSKGVAEETIQAVVFE